MSVRLCVGVGVCVSDKTTINYYHLNTGTGRHGLLLPVLLWKLQLTLPRPVFLLSSSRREKGGGGGEKGLSSFSRKIRLATVGLHCLYDDIIGMR